jgi:gluconate 2-dehydrogenase alpha chain
MEEKVPALLALNPHEARTAAALFERLFPADEHGPGATEIGVLTYVDRALAGPYKDKTETYRLGLAALDRAALNRYSSPLADCDLEQQNALIVALEEGTLPDFKVPPQRDFFKMLRDHLQEGLFADPAHGGNRDKLGGAHHQGRRGALASRPWLLLRRHPWRASGDARLRPAEER